MSIIHDALKKNEKRVPAAVVASHEGGRRATAASMNIPPYLLAVFAFMLVVFSISLAYIIFAPADILVVRSGEAGSLGAAPGRGAGDPNFSSSGTVISGANRLADPYAAPGLSRGDPYSAPYATPYSLPGGPGYAPGYAASYGGNYGYAPAAAYPYSYPAEGATAGISAQTAAGHPRITVRPVEDAGNLVTPPPATTTSPVRIPPLPEEFAPPTPEEALSTRRSRQRTLLRRAEEMQAAGDEIGRRSLLSQVVLIDGETPEAREAAAALDASIGGEGEVSTAPATEGGIPPAAVNGGDLPEEPLETIEISDANLGSIIGDVSVVGGEARPGARLRVGSSLTTRGNGSAEINFENATVEIGEGTSTRITRLQRRSSGGGGGAEEATVHLDSGRIETVVHTDSPDESFLVSTDPVTAASRNGAFSVETGEDGSVTVSARAGIVEVVPHDNPNERRIVPAGSSAVYRDGRWLEE